jgi:uncharacterized membrane protein YgcG
MRFLRCLRVLLPALLLTVGTAGGARAEVERILAFGSHIQVHEDASMTVTETITVQAEGRQIKRGIKRDFPTSYRDRLGNRVRVGFEVMEVLRDGAPEPYSTQAAGNGVQVKIGDKDVLLAPGPHRYTITYRTNRQLGFFEDYDELYWNVTGTGWSFAIDRAQAVIELPPGARMIQQSGYTGPQGATAGHYNYSREGGRHIFRTTRGLAPREGLTIALAWPKGYVQAPSREERLGYFFADNRSTLVALGGLGLVFGYFLLVWTMVGRDPDKGTVIPRYAPPTGLSPAAMRYVMRMGYDDKAFSAALVSLAVKGRITIEEEGKTYRLNEARRVVSAVSPGERRVAEKLLNSSDSILLHHSNHRAIRAAMKALKKYLALEYEKGYFVTNRVAFIGGAMLVILALAATALSAEFPPTALFLLVWTSVWTLGCASLVYAVFKAWKGALAGGPNAGKQFFAAIFISLFSLPFLGGEGMGLTFLAEQITVPATAVVAVNLVMAVAFYQWLKAPTRAGRKLMDEIEGFKQYLSVAEQDRLETLHPPEKTPELFEKYLPYALALGVENQWSEQFAGLAADAGQDRSDRGYHPHWYRGDGWRRDGLSGLGRALGGSFAGSVASSSSPPGSSSGSGGGGSSGGGGGGGGGSGW